MALSKAIENLCFKAHIAFVVWLVVLFGFFVQPSEVFAVDGVEKTEQQIIAEAKSIAKKYHDLGWFSGTMLIAHSGEIIFEQAYGYADIGKGTPNTINTLFNLGSIMKHYTAVLVLQQVERGTLTLDDKLAKFELGFSDEIANKITLRHLLNHKSGFPDIFTAEYRENQLHFDTIEKKLTLLKRAELKFEPGSDESYSNYGYVVLGAVLQKQTGMSFSELLKKEIFQPLELENSFYPYDHSQKNQSKRYNFTHAGELKFVGVTEHHGPDGGIEATAKDVMKFFYSLFRTDKLLSQTGSAIKEYFNLDHRHWGSYGGGYGVSSASEFGLKNNYQIIVLANSDNLVAELISGKVARYIYNIEYEAVKLPPHVYAFKQYQQMGVEEFQLNFAEKYKSDGYTQFIGRTLNDLGMSLVAEKSWEDAMNVLEALQKLFPQAPQVYDSLAFAWQKRGEQDKAKEQFSIALSKQAGFKSEYSNSNYGISN